jgi:hypothetical protein
MISKYLTAQQQIASMKAAQKVQMTQAQLDAMVKAAAEGIRKGNFKASAELMSLKGKVEIVG